MGGYLNSEEIHLSSFTYYTAVNNFSPEANCYFSKTADGTDDPNFTSTSIDTDKLNEPQYYLVIEKFNDVSVALEFTPLKYGSYDPIPYNVAVTNEQDNSESYSVSVSGEDGNTSFSIPLGKTPVYRNVYGFIYSFEPDALNNAVPDITYSSTVTVTVTEGS